MRWRDRSATDLAVIGILLIVGVVLIVSIIGIFLVELLRPEVDIGPIIQVESEILAILVGALVGFVGGRELGHQEASQRRDD